MLKTKTLLPLVILLALALSACGGDEGNSAEVLTQAAQIAIDGLTQTAEAAPPTPTPTVMPTNTPEPTPTNSPTPDLTLTAAAPTALPANTQPAGSSGGGGTPCLRANLEYETIPDGTQYPVDKVFQKTWRLKNTGTCTWNSNYSIVWVEGEIFNTNSVNPITEVDVAPNQYVEITLTVVMPSKAGNYIGYFMLRSDDGTYFGVGPNGKSWFWLDVEAIIPPS